jgi:hypothetical protein
MRITATNTAASVWIFQPSPRKYDLVAALADKRIGKRMHWVVNQYSDAISKGDLGLICLAGRRAGIYALARIESDPHPMRERPAEREYWLLSAPPETSVGVELTILRRLTQSSILRSSLKRIPGL